MKSSSLFLLIMFTLTNRVYSIENNFKEVRKGKFVEPRYNFNHPPSVENYNPIPVAVVYEDINNYSSKSGKSSLVNEADNSYKELLKGKFVEPRHYLNHPPSVENYNPIPVAIVFEDNNYSGKSETTIETKIDKSDEDIKVGVTDNTKNDETATKHEQDNGDTLRISANTKTNAKLVAKPRVLSNFQIPVAILYESDSSSYQNHRKRKTDTSADSQKSRSSYSRKFEASTNTENEHTAPIAKEETKKLQPELDTRVFKKRKEDSDPVVPILEMESYVFSHNGNFHYRYESGDGTKSYSEGKQITIDGEAGESVVGGFSYKDKEGNDFSLTYTADENGYRPVGDHLPTPPPIPPAIARALEYLATATPKPVTKRPEKSKQIVS